MNKQYFNIKDIPSVLWGDKADKLFISVHGNMSNKADDVISILAEEAVREGYQVLSFDLPQHGDRKHEDYACTVQNCIKDLEVIIEYAKTLAKDISLFACSIGAFFSLLAYRVEKFNECVFLSPVVDMERIITNMMTAFNVTEKQLEEQKEIDTPIGQKLYWDYYSFVKSNPITVWNNSTSILYGSNDNICEFDIVSSFVTKFNCDLKVMEHGEHFFHTKQQLGYFRNWLVNQLMEGNSNGYN